MTTMTMQIKKPTMATVKAFIKNNRETLWINVKSSFDGMVDGCVSLNDGFTKATEDKTQSIDSSYYRATQGIKGAWFVGQSRDYITRYESESMMGFDISNSCGHFILAIHK